MTTEDVPTRGAPTVHDAKTTNSFAERTTGVVHAGGQR
jgi:hypothetical protein